jgi:hypothetical protein
MNIDQQLHLLLSNGGAQGNANAGTASLLSLLGQHQPQQQQPAANSGSVDSQLIAALLQHQSNQQKQREEQEKVLLIQKLNALANPSHSQANELALKLLLQQKMQMQAPPSNNNNNFNLLAGLSNPLFGSNVGANLASTQGNQLDAATVALLLQGHNNNAGASVAAAAAPMPQVPQGLDMAASLAASGDRRRKGRTGTFPQKLHQMLSDLERQEGGPEIASFMPHGRAFAIHKPRDFVKHVMPKYFRMSRFSSFQRQLNLYDFQRITEGPDKGSYFHELFAQGRPILSTMMKRNKIKGVKNKNNEAAAAVKSDDKKGLVDKEAEDDHKDVEQEEV